MRSPASLFVALAVLAAVTGGLAPRPAWAQDAGASARYAVVSIAVSGDADPQLRAQLEAGIALGIQRAGAAVVPFDDVQAALASKPALQGCVSTTCLASIGALVAAGRFLAVTVSAAGANYELELEVLGADGTTRERTASCTVCTITELGELVAARIHDLLTATAGAPLPIAIDSRPGGATLTIPGAGTHAAPWSGMLPPGTYVVEARKAGHATARQEIMLEDDGTEHRYELLLAPLEVSPLQRRTRWALAGTAAAALISGVVLMVMDGNPTCDVGGVTCPEVYDTGGAGIGLSLVGLAAGGAAGWLFWRDR